MDTNVLPIRKASEEIGVADLETLRKAAKKFGALIIVAGLEYVDVTRFNEGVKSELQAKIEQVARRANAKSTNGRKIGLIKARIERAPGLVVGKEGAVSAAKKQLDEAPTPYDRARARKLLADLELGLKRLRDGFAKDKSELDRILNEELEA